KKERLPAERRQHLDRIGFDWEPLRRVAEKWDRRLDELKAFKRRFGHCNVPYRWPENPSLGRWVQGQRHKQASLPPQRRKRLDRLGFAWRIPNPKNRRLESLI